MKNKIHAFALKQNGFVSNMIKNLIRPFTRFILTGTFAISLKRAFASIKSVGRFYLPKGIFDAHIFVSLCAVSVICQKFINFSFHKRLFTNSADKASASSESHLFPGMRVSVQQEFKAVRPKYPLSLCYQYQLVVRSCSFLVFRWVGMF